MSSPILNGNDDCRDNAGDDIPDVDVDILVTILLLRVNQSNRDQNATQRTFDLYDYLIPTYIIPLNYLINQEAIKTCARLEEMPFERPFASA